MSDLTISIDAETEAALSRLESAAEKPREQIVAEAVAAFVRDEEEIVAAILRGRAEVDAGRTVSHADAMARFRKTARGA